VITGAGATSPPSTAPSLGPSPPQFQTHFYGPATASHHHPGTIAGGPHSLPPPPPHAQMEHLYYTYPPSPHTAQPPSHHGGALALAADQQLLIYSTELSGQTSASESQFNHPEVHFFNFNVSFHFSLPLWVSQSVFSQSPIFNARHDLLKNCLS
jgi:hypothetical protein